MCVWSLLINHTLLCCRTDLPLIRHIPKSHTFSHVSGSWRHTFTSSESFHAAHRIGHEKIKKYKICKLNFLTSCKCTSVNWTEQRFSIDCSFRFVVLREVSISCMIRYFNTPFDINTNAPLLVSCLFNSRMLSDIYQNKSIFSISPHETALTNEQETIYLHIVRSRTLLTNESKAFVFPSLWPCITCLLLFVIKSITFCI